MTNKLKAASSKLEIGSSASSGERGGGGNGSGGSSQDTGLNNLNDKSNMKNIEQHQQQPPILPPSSGGNLLNGQQNPQDQSQTTNGNILLEENIWFHGVLPRLEVVRLLQEDGDFLVRETVRENLKQIVVSVMWSIPKHFIVQTSPEGLFRFEGPGFNTVQELIMHQFHSGMLIKC